MIRLPPGGRSAPFPMGLEQIGKYQVVAKIGEGAMGEVYKARDPLLNRNVAIKTISGSLAADPQFKERFKRERSRPLRSITRTSSPSTSTATTRVSPHRDGVPRGVDLREAIRARRSAISAASWR